MKKGLNPVVERAKWVQSGFRQGVDASFNVNMLFVMLALDNANAELNILSDEDFGALLRETEQEMDRIYKEVFDGDVQNMVQYQQKTLEERTDSILYHVNEKRTKYGLKPYDFE